MSVIPPASGKAAELASVSGVAAMIAGIVLGFVVLGVVLRDITFGLAGLASLVACLPMALEARGRSAGRRTRASANDGARTGDRPEF